MRITETRTREPTEIEAAIVALLRLHKELSTQEVADGVKRDLSRASRVLNRLEAAKLVTHRLAQDEDEPRAKWKMWRLTVEAR